MQKLLTKKEKKLSQSSNFTFCYLDDVCSMFSDNVDHIYLIEFEIKDTTETAMSASNIDLQLEIERWLTVKLYDSRNYLNFPTVNILFNCKANSAVLAYISLPYFAACISYKNFLDRWVLLTAKLWNQVFLIIKLKSIVQMCYYRRHHVLISLYGISVKILTRKVKEIFIIEVRENMKILK